MKNSSASPASRRHAGAVSGVPIRVDRDAAKTPDTDSYWRCTSCGEMWNVARSRPATAARSVDGLKQKRIVRDLRELIAALDRRVPRM